MKYTLKLPIELSRDKVCELFINPENWRQWQERLISYELISGTHGNPGSKTKMINKLGSKKIEITETIESNNLPEKLVCIYEAPNVWNRVVYRFIESSSDTTEWEFESEFKCGGLLSVMAFLMPGIFKKTTKSDLEAFKKFAESNI